MSERPVRHAPSVAPYPWDRLDQLPREAVTTLPSLRRLLRRVADEDALGIALAELTNERVTLSVHCTEVLAGPVLPSVSADSFVLATSEGRVQLGVEIDRALSLRLVEKVLGRPPRLPDPTRPLEAPILGAVSAIVAAVARRAHGSGAVLLPLGPGALRVHAGERYIRVHVTVVMGREAFSVVVSSKASGIELAGAPSDGLSASDLLLRLGEVPLSLPTIVAMSLMTQDDLAQLSTGDAWLPGQGWTIRREASSLVGEVRFGAPSSERGISGRLNEDGTITMGARCAIPQEIEAMDELESNDATVEKEAVLDAPLVVRVEMGAVTLTAREWANLAQGDVIALEKRIAEPLSLRIAGIEVARGELVEIEGELGVRILEKRGSR